MSNFAQTYYTTTSYSNDATTEGVGVVAGIVIVLVYLALFVLWVLGVIGLWKTFTKAGKPGWAAIVPVYNGMVIAEVAGKPSWWGLGFLISPLNLIVGIICGIAIAKRFGRSEAFGVVALGLFSFVGFLVVGFGKDTYDESATPTVQ